MNLRALVAALVVAAVSGCDSSPTQLSKNPPDLSGTSAAAPSTGTARQELGEVVDTYPLDQERMVLVLTNLARHAPLNECGDWTEEQAGNAPKAPLVYSRTGNIAGRYMSKHMADIGCFQHESCCVLGNVNGQVECTAQAQCDSDQCGKTCTGGTPIAQRYQLLGMTTWSGENIARGYPSAKAVWCGWMNSTGHRQNIYSGHSELGVGVYSAGSSCGLYWTQSFGSGGGNIPRIPAASAIYGPPNPQDATSVYFAANYYDNVSQKAPKRSVVVVNGHCFDATKAWGLDYNGTWETHFTAPDDIPAGCHPYYFIFVDDNADRWTYPDQGSLYLPLGNGVTCPNSYDVGQLPADCETGVQTCTEGATQNCYTGPAGTEGVGICRSGTQTCKNGFWSACNAQKVPGVEVCDGLDNNCDGTADEGNPGGNSSCSVPSERGECKAGTKQCIAGGLTCVSTYAPQVEACDGLDNDCDGVVDDGFGQVSCGKGECFRIVDACSNGAAQTCTPGTPSAEVADGKDNDCDGVVDNDVDCRRADGGFGFFRQFYSYPTALADGGTLPLILPCKRGVQQCQEDGGWNTVDPDLGPEPEVCDGKDNDCDNVVDNVNTIGWQRCGTGTCTSFAQECRQGKPFACTPSNPGDETCDGTDDNCNGTIDEGCDCREGTSFTCYSGSLLTLDAGVCHTGTQSCNAGHWTGCEGEVAPSTEYCDQVDNDCNGAVDDNCVQKPAEDAGVDAGHPSGSDAGTGAADAGDGGGGGGGGCGCAAGPVDVAPFAGVAWLALAWLARRRRTV